MKSNKESGAFWARFAASSVAVLFFLLLGSAIWAQAPVTVSGTVKDNTAAPVQGADVLAINPGTSTIVKSALTDSTGYYEMAIPTGTYNFAVIAPPGSSFANSELLGQSILANTVLNFVLVPSGLVVLNGCVLDGLGQGVPNQGIALDSGAARFGQTTDATGYYSFQLEPGNYGVIMQNGTSAPAAAPRNYIILSNLSLTQNMVMDIPLPAKRVDLHVQDPAGNPVANVAIGTNYAENYSMEVGPLVGYGYSSTDAVTDAAGNATLWLFPTDPDFPYLTYTFCATPPAGSPWAITSLSGITFISDTAVTMTMALPVALQGRVLDGLGNGVPNQGIALDSGATRFGQTTDATGYYSFHVAPGNYGVIMQNGTVAPAAAPRSYLFLSHLSLTQDTVMDIPLPAKRVDLRVQDPAGNPVANVAIGTNYAENYSMDVGPLVGYGYSSTDAVTDAAGNATLWLFPTDPDFPYYTYTFCATPPAGSPWAITSLSGIALIADTSVTMTMALPVTLQGRVLDGLGNGVPNQGIALDSGATRFGQTTDASGYYSFHVAPGNYGVIMQNGTSEPAAAPRSYLFLSHLSLTQDTVMDIPLPAKRVELRVQDPAGNPVGNVAIGTNYAENYSMEVGPLVGYGYSSTEAVTDAAGNATLWLFPTDPDFPHYTYTFCATPPAGSPFEIFNVQNVIVISDITEVVVLQYTEPPTPIACPLSHGFWKNKVEYWPVDALTLGTESYSLAELIAILKTNAGADASLILAYQLIAAKANIAWGSNPAPIADTIAQADNLLSGFNGKLPYAVRSNTKKGKQMTALGKSLEEYNLKLLTPTCNPLAPTVALTQAEREIQTLKLELGMLRPSEFLKKARIDLLAARLNGAIINRENPQAARQAIEAFKLRVFDLIRDGTISRMQGHRLIEKANRILLRIGY